jgi:hypothetical protein
MSLTFAGDTLVTVTDVVRHHENNVRSLGGEQWRGECLDGEECRETKDAIHGWLNPVSQRGVSFQLAKMVSW